MESKTLAFAIDRDQFQAWRDATGSHDSQSIVVTADWQVACELETIGQPYSEVWSYLEAADIGYSQQLCQQLAAEWWRPFLGEIEHKGVQLADAMSRDMWFFFATAINANTVVNRILDAEKPERIVLFSDLEKATLWNPPDGPYPDVFNAVALWIAKKRQLPVHCLTTKRRPFPKVKNPVNENQPQIPITSPVFPFEFPVDSRQGTALIFVDRIDYNNHRGLIKMLHESADCHCILLRAGHYDAPEVNNQALD